MSYSPSRLTALHIYSKRIIRWRSNSYPFLSGDAFLDLADSAFEVPRFRNKPTAIKDLLKSNVIFVNSGSLIQFLEDNFHNINAKVIISGNGDIEFHKAIRLPASVNLLLLQNSFISDGTRIRTLPIGIENFRWGVNGNPRLITYSRYLDNCPNLMVGPFGFTHESRRGVIRQFENAFGPWKCFSGYYKPKKFNELSSQFSHVACVRGNGVDTHRIWETLYRGRTPLVLRDRWSESLTNLSLPIHLIDSWDPAALVPELILSLPKYEPKSIPELWMPYWENLINKYIWASKRR